MGQTNRSGGNKGIKVLVVFGTRPEAIKMCPLVKTFRKRNTMEAGVCVTGQHRQMRGMFQAFRRVVDSYPDVKAVYPMHPNPAVREIAREILGGSTRIRLIEPLNVVDFHNLMSRAYFLLSDSGGVQEEATALGKPVLVMRNTTERPEGVEAGTLRLVGTDTETIFAECQELLESPEQYKKMTHAHNPCGDGTASARIAAIVERDFLRRPI